uniref:Lipoprotein signal peptidase n=1 Tax=candidate division WOR-3 bacterium TaxID=2052148 RepID=A0A7C4YBJ4_UNCW3
MKKYLLLIITTIIIIIDQITKSIIRNSFWLGESRSLISDYLRLTYVRNPNIIWGINIGGPKVSLILTGIAFIFVVYLFIKSKEKLFLISLSLILGGAIGNLIDRIILGEVTDFIDMGIGNFRWATYNIADAAVSIGLVIGIISYIIESNVNPPSRN